MSTFNGQMPEFPDIRGRISSHHGSGVKADLLLVDFFRLAPGTRPPLACFLSHAHSDHLAGLESLKAPLLVS
jgi:DNA cross-link repair 1C protein